jgi:hypothetical protein
VAFINLFSTAPKMLGKKYVWGKAEMEALSPKPLNLGRFHTCQE